MASWMLHLRIADLLLQRFPELAPEPFVAGNFAPDSGSLNKDRMTYTPSKQISHWKLPKEQGGTIQDVLFEQEYLQKSNLEAEEKSFYLGVYAHLLTDKDFGATIFRPLKEQMQDEIDDERAFFRDLKWDWYQVDVRYLAEHPDFVAYRVLQGIKDFPNRYFPFFQPDAFTNKLREIKGAYSLQDLNPSYQFRYFSGEQAAAFVERISSLLTEKIQFYL